MLHMPLQLLRVLLLRAPAPVLPEFSPYSIIVCGENSSCACASL